ncbi:MAG: SUMF1/EgtB/PvdO family nonheme iron enzyme [Nitrospirota bacterium]
MAGNVWDWCASWYDEEDSQRVIRGGSWFNSPGNLRASFRNWIDADDRYYFLGFRLAQDIEP